MVLDGNNDFSMGDDAAEATWIVPSLMLTSSLDDAPSDMAALVSPKSIKHSIQILKVLVRFQY